MSTLLRVFASVRMAVGAGAWLAPNLSARAFGLDGARDPVVTQLFGARDLALGLALQQAAPGPARTRALQMGVFCDVLDAIAVLRGVRRRAVRPAAVALVGAGAVTFAAIGVVSLRRQAVTDPSETIEG